VESLFGVPFDELDLERVRTFLAEAADEGLTWEAKGDHHSHRWVRPQQVYIPACGFANSHLPGVILLGADRDRETGRWKLNGLERPGGDEPTTWLTNVLRSALRPIPRFAISQVWELPDDRVAVAVLVEPTPEPPCITRDGQVFQRTSGATVPVADPLVLARLYEGGDAARERAEAKAVNIAPGSPGLLAGMEGGGWPDNRASVTVSAASVGYAPDIASRLFATAFRDGLLQEFERYLSPGHGEPNETGAIVRQRQDRVLARRAPRWDDAFQYFWGVVADWSGSVAVTCLTHGAGLTLFVEEILSPAWTVTTRLVDQLGGEGRQHVVVSLDKVPLSFSSTHQPVVSAAARAWVDIVGEPPASAIEAVTNELRRATGETVWVE
jgi:hypothetical protein